MICNPPNVVIAGGAMPRNATGGGPSVSGMFVTGFALESVTRVTAACDRVHGRRAAAPQAATEREYLYEGYRLRRLRHAVRRPFRHPGLRARVPRTGRRAQPRLALQAARVHLAPLPHGPLPGFLARYGGCARIRLPRAWSGPRAGSQGTLDGRIPAAGAFPRGPRHAGRPGQIQTAHPFQWIAPHARRRGGECRPDRS